MSVHLPPSSDRPLDTESASSGSQSDDDQEFGDWVSDSADNQPCKSLFDDQVFPSADAAVAHDKEAHGFDLNKVCSTLALDFHQRIRLINYVRKEKPPPAVISSLEGSEPFLSADEYLKPVVEDDPLLRFDSSDDWSDDDDNAAERTSEPTDAKAFKRRIAALEKKLAEAKQDLVDYRAFVGERLDIARLSEAISSDSADVSAALRDDDTHYFDSYGENDIHAVMIQDRVRTSTYASFILRTPALFQDAIVLDVGCGTGILSLFAARAGAKHVFAVDASPIAEKARKIVQQNQLEDVITVIHGKIEDITLPFPEGHTHVDVIVSEWMGYALLYESMLDSVLIARDRFLRSPAPTPAEPTVEGMILEHGGVLAPSQCRMMLGLCDAKEVFKERVSFWNDVHGFDLSEMAKGVYDDAIVDVVDSESMLSESITLKDIYLPTATPRTLNFTAPFTLVSNSARRTKVRAFLLYFDTFFSPDGTAVPEDARPQPVRDGDLRLAEVWPLGSQRRRASQDPATLQLQQQQAAAEAGGDRPILPRKPSLKRLSNSQSGDKDKEKPLSAEPEEMKQGEAERPPPPKHARRSSLGEGLKKDKFTSFTTGPDSIPTHWKQTVFLLRDPIAVQEGTIVKGVFHCRKSENNKRELDVEIHYEVFPPEGEEAEGKGKAKQGSGVTVQMFKVR